MKPWFKNVTPHNDIKQDHLDESVFAANLAEVATGAGREIYQNPDMFFKKTYFTAGIQNIVKKVIQGLNGGQDSENRVISLQTGFGGGKTHSLISLYHIIKCEKDIKSIENVKDILSETAEPGFDNVKVAVFTNKTNDPVQGRKVEGLHIRTLWGEIAYQLGGKEIYEVIKANDERKTAPKGIFKNILEKVKPALILIDELADYCVAASGVSVGSSTLSDQTISFIQELSEAISTTDNCVLVATLPASEAEVANSPRASQILTSLSNRLGRIGVDTKPVADEEIFEVIRTRLFEDIGEEKIIEDVVSEYMGLYQSHFTELPQQALRAEYKELLKKSYPFHPELIDIFRIRWASNHDFQRTRGVLRLLASIVADLWKRQGSLTGSNYFIHTSDVDFQNLDALSGQLKKLYGNGYDAVITADVSGSSSNAFKIDMDKKEYGNFNLTQGIASTILLGSFGSTGPNKGISIQELKLCILKPNTFNHNSVNGALDVLESTAHYLYYSSVGSDTKRYWFHTKPNINILINQAKSDVKQPDIYSEILKRINSKVAGITFFNALLDPSVDIPEQKKSALVILHPKYLAATEKVSVKTKKVIEKIATKKGLSERIYRNTILFLVCSEMGMGKLNSDIRDYLACIKIKEEYQSQLEREQKDDITSKIDEYTKNVNTSLVTAYSVIIKHSAKEGLRRLNIKQFKDSIDTQVNVNINQALKDEEWLLDGVGVACLSRNNLMPTANTPIKVKDVYEAFLRYDDKPMITGLPAVQDSLLRHCNNGAFAIAAGDGKDFENIYYKQSVPYFDVTDSSYWLVDKSLYKPDTGVRDTGETGDTDGDTGASGDSGRTGVTGGGVTGETTTGDIKTFKSITISGKVDVANYKEIFTSFVIPLIKNKVEIEIKVTGKFTEANPLTESSDQYKITKESAKQLGLQFEEDIDVS